MTNKSLEKNETGKVSVPDPVFCIPEHPPHSQTLQYLRALAWGPCLSGRNLAGTRPGPGRDLAGEVSHA